MRKLAISGLFEYIQYGYKVKIIDSNMIANMELGKQPFSEKFRHSGGTPQGGNGIDITLSGR